MDARAAQHFTHIRGLLIGRTADSATVYSDPDHPNPEYFQRLDERIKYMNSKGIVADLILGGKARTISRSCFPAGNSASATSATSWRDTAAMNITWQGVEEFESYDERPRAAEGDRDAAEAARSVPASANHGHRCHLGVRWPTTAG